MSSAENRSEVIDEAANMSENERKRRFSHTPQKPPAKKALLKGNSDSADFHFDLIENQETDVDDDSELRTAVMNALEDGDVLSDLTNRIMLSVKSALKKEVNDAVAKKTADLRETVRVQANEIIDLKKRIEKIEIRAEEQEQYTRRNCLRFSNIPFKLPDGSTPQSPWDLDTDKIVLDICNNKLGVPIQEDDISRSHVVGTPDKGKCQIIARFVTYRKRQKVFAAKSNLRNDPKKRYIVEDLTKYRFGIVKRLGQLRKDRKIAQYWTFDGRIFMRTEEHGPKILLKSMEDIEKRLRS
ncbi:hypothetical protein FSP39_011407 [Pinctada imbricata]|uniref:Uncharacterized protein n=1 Tax=Pinctada imbricata TaxID=66713 RepID=A0AA88YI89_PINIB|nr:hypothetical protein FSP39_011407 [Pinctada imbricata]